VCNVNSVGFRQALNLAYYAPLSSYSRCIASWDTYPRCTAELEQEALNPKQICAVWCDSRKAHDHFNNTHT
jgi:hypothetical protein